MVTLPPPVLVRFGGTPTAGPFTPDALRVAPEKALWGLTPLFSRGLPVPLFLKLVGGSGSGREPVESVLLPRLAGEKSRVGTRGSAAL